MPNKTEALAHKTTDAESLIKPHSKPWVTMTPLAERSALNTWVQLIASMVIRVLVKELKDIQYTVHLYNHQALQSDGACATDLDADLSDEHVLHEELEQSYNSIRLQ